MAGGWRSRAMLKLILWQGTVRKLARGQCGGAMLKLTARRVASELGNQMCFECFVFLVNTIISI